MHPLGLAAVVVLSVATLLLPRKYALTPMLIMLYFVSPAQRITVLGLDFNCIRLLILAGWIRLFMRKETTAFRWIRMDTLFLTWAISSTVIFGMQWGVAGIIARTGSHIYEQFGAYLLIRNLVRDWDDVVALVQTVCILAFPCVVFFMLEWSSGRNVFAVFGGVPSVTIVRDGRLRCQGAFTHAIIAGCAWATWMPIIASLWWWELRQRWLVVLGLIASTLIVISTASSTPVFTAAAAAVGIAFFPLRYQMRLVRWSVVGGLTLLHLIMKAPVWHLIARVSAVGGSTGYHRYLLIENFIHRFDEWWFMGVRSTAHWGWGQEDVTNHIILQGVTGGLVSLVLFVLLIAEAFKNAGATWRAVRDAPREVWLAWGLGAVVFAHLMAFLGVSYFGQGNVILALHLALVGSLFQSKCKAPSFAASSPASRSGMPHIRDVERGIMEPYVSFT